MEKSEDIPKFCLYNKTDDVPLPIKSMMFDCEIVNDLAKVTQIIHFKNNSDKTIHANLLYPKSLRGNYSGIQIYVGDLVLEGDVIEKKKA